MPPKRACREPGPRIKAPHGDKSTATMYVHALVLRTALILGVRLRAWILTLVRLYETDNGCVSAASKSSLPGHRRVILRGSERGSIVVARRKLVALAESRRS